MPEKYLVTGGAGFIGSNIAETLLDEGLAVRILDNVSTGKEENLALLTAKGGDLEIVRGDIRNLDEVRAAVAGGRLRHPPGGAAVGSQVRPAAAGVQRQQHQRGR